MKNGKLFQKSVTNAVGMTMIISWVLFHGPLGALLLGGIAYSMLAQNVAAGIICGFLSLWPPLLTLAWGAMKCCEVLRKDKATRDSFLLPTESVHPQTQSLEM